MSIASQTYTIVRRDDLDEMSVAVNNLIEAAVQNWDDKPKGEAIAWIRDVYARLRSAA